MGIHCGRDVALYGYTYRMSGLLPGLGGPFPPRPRAVIIDRQGSHVRLPDVTAGDAGYQADGDFVDFIIVSADHEEDSNYWTFLGSNVVGPTGPAMTNINAGAGSGGLLRSVIRDPANAIVQLAQSTLPFQDRDWHLCVGQDIWNAINAGLNFSKVDGAAREGAHVDTYTRWAVVPGRMQWFALGGWLRGPDPPVFLAQAKGRIAYYARVASEGFSNAELNVVWDAFNTGGGRHNLWHVTRAIIAAITTGTILWAGGLDGCSKPHVGSWPEYIDPQFETADLAPQAAEPIQIYFIGNSLSSDGFGASYTVIRSLLDGAGYASTGGQHIACGHDLDEIHNNPGFLCETAVAPFGQWTTALDGFTFEVLVFQMHHALVGTLSTDVAAILFWAAKQPSAIIVLHAAVAPEANLLDYWDGSPPTLTPPEDPDTLLAPNYFDRLWDEVEPTLGDRLRLAPVGEITHAVALQAGSFPDVDVLGDLYVSLEGEPPSHPSPVAQAIAAVTIASVIANEMTLANQIFGVAQATVNAVYDEVQLGLRAEPRSRF